MKKIVKKVFVVFVLILGVFIMLSFLRPNATKDNKEKNEDTLVTEVEVNKQNFKANLQNSRRLKEAISNDIKIVALEEKGSMKLFHDKKKSNNKLANWFVHSNVELKLEYTASIGIKSENIKISCDSQRIQIDISKDRFFVQSVNIENITLQTNKGMFAKKYLPSEISAITLIATEKVEEEILNDEEILLLAEANLKDYLENLANDLGIVNLKIV